MPAKHEFLATGTNKMQTLVSRTLWAARAGPGGVAVCGGDCGLGLNKCICFLPPGGGYAGDHALLLL